MSSTSQKTALVTGANKGIGKQIAKRLAQEGFTVWIGSRDEARGKTTVDELKAQDLNVKLLVIDVSNDSSVATAAAELAKQTSVLDVLVNNAGIILDGTFAPSQISLDLVKETYETNVFGPIRSIQAFLPLIKASKSGRIVNVSSLLGSITSISDKSSPVYGFNAVAYSSSKSALNAITVSYAKELAPFGIKVNASHPGYVATEINNYQGVITVEEGAEIQIKLAMLPADGPTGQLWAEEGVLAW